MPNTHSTLTALFSDIADSIRSKAGTSTPIIADAFPAAIDAIPTGGGDSVADGIIDKTISGAYTNANVSSIGSSAFYSCTSLTAVSFPVCTSIGSYAFGYCISLTTANFPVCTSINNSVFYSCSSLTEASFPVCTSIGTSAFGYCISLTEASFPVCSFVGSYAFMRCSSLTTVSFPVCTTINNSAFSNCNRLLSLYLLGSSVPRLSNINAFSSTPISNYTTETGGVNGSIIVQSSMLNAFKTATNWSVYSSRFSVWNGVD